MNVGVVVFPGSNCDHDAWYAMSRNLEHNATFIWHQQDTIGGVDAVILPGGFSYGDYLRTGAIAKFSPVIGAVRKFARDGGLVLGLCNGFQILTESGILPGALVRNASLKYVCKTVELEVATARSPFTQHLSKGSTIRIPVSHGEGCYVAEEAVLDQLERDDRVAFRYRENPNGSQRNIAGVLNEQRNVLGMMPHPERAADALLGNCDGLKILSSFAAAITESLPASTSIS